MAAAKKTSDTPDTNDDSTGTAALPAAKADITVDHIVADPQASVLAEDSPAIGTGDPTVPRADSHDPRPAPDGR